MHEVIVIHAFVAAEGERGRAGGWGAQSWSHLVCGELYEEGLLAVGSLVKIQRIKQLGGYIHGPAIINSGVQQQAGKRGSAALIMTERRPVVT